MTRNLDPTDRVLTLRLLTRKQDQLVVLKQEGSPISITTRKYQPVSRGGKGHALFKRRTLKGAEPLPVELPILETENHNPKPIKISGPPVSKAILDDRR